MAARAIIDLAELARGKDEFVEARRLAQRSLEQFPESPWVDRARQIIREIEQPEATVTVERVWAEPWPMINVRYRNTTKLHLKLIRFNYDDFLKSNRWSPLQMDEPLRRSFVRQTAVKQWSIDLPKTDDYRERIEKVVVPQDVPRGCYVLIASSDAAFTDNQNQLSLSEVWVSRLAMIVRTDQSLNQLEVLVTDNQTGTPIPGATVKVWQVNQTQTAVQGETLKTDANGIAKLEATQRERLYLVASHNGDQIASGQPLYFNRYDAGDGRSTQTQFFTDRAIYRPGQTIQYKGFVSPTILARLSTKRSPINRSPWFCEI